MKKVFLLLLCLSVASCATVPKNAPQRGNDVYSKLKKMEPEEALHLGTIIYNVPPQDYEDELAKNITFGEYLKKMKSKSSRVIRESGLFKLKYEPVKLGVLPNAQLIKLYELYVSRFGATRDNISDVELSEDEIGRKIIYATAAMLIRKELEKRNLISTGTDIAINLLGIALSIAAAAI